MPQSSSATSSNIYTNLYNDSIPPTEPSHPGHASSQPDLWNGTVKYAALSTATSAPAAMFTNGSKMLIYAKESGFKEPGSYFCMKCEETAVTVMRIASETGQALFDICVQPWEKYMSRLSQLGLPYSASNSGETYPESSGTTTDGDSPMTSNGLPSRDSSSFATSGPSSSVNRPLQSILKQPSSAPSSGPSSNNSESVPSTSAPQTGLGTDTDTDSWWSKISRAPAAVKNSLLGWGGRDNSTLQDTNEPLATLPTSTDLSDGATTPQSQRSGWFSDMASGARDAVTSGLGSALGRMVGPRHRAPMI